MQGTVRVGEEQIELRGSGQRDHSWGTRDWWSAEWMWSAGHLQDGTRFHAVEFRLPGTPPIGVGYLQPPEGGVVELDWRIRLGGGRGRRADHRRRDRPGRPHAGVEPLAFGPLRLEAPDGRLSEFPRAMCRVLAGDGRTGVAWVEWNRNASLC